MQPKQTGYRFTALSLMFFWHGGIPHPLQRSEKGTKGVLPVKEPQRSDFALPIRHGGHELNESAVFDNLFSKG